MTDAQPEVAAFPTSRSAFDPPVELGELRERRPVCPFRTPDGMFGPGGQPGWLVTSYRRAREVLSDPRFTVRPLLPPPYGGRAEEVRLRSIAEDAVAPGIVIIQDPPEHTRLRRMQTGHLTASRVGERRDGIERIAADCLDAMERAGSPADLVETFASPFSSFAICELLGVSRGDRDEFERPEAIVQDPHAAPEEKIAADRRFFDYARAVIERKRARPSDDLLSELAVAGELSDEELTGVARTLFGAGHHTTATMVAFSVYALLSDRRRWEALLADPSSIDVAVEELLRYLTIVQTTVLCRQAQADVELEGDRIGEGEAVVVSLTAANRDPDKFPDPDVLDLARDARGHLAFGFGRHMCLGQHLARVELQVALASLLERFPALRLAVPAEAVRLYGGEHLVYGVRELPVAW